MDSTLFMAVINGLLGVLRRSEERREVWRASSKRARLEVEVRITRQEDSLRDLLTE